MVDIVFDGLITGTGINLGGSDLNNYEEGDWNPTFTFSTPGDLSVVYALQSGTYTREGNRMLISCHLNVTPTFTTSSGQIKIGAIPVASANIDVSTVVKHEVNIAYPAGITTLMMALSASSATMELNGVGSATASARLGPSAITSGVSFVIQFTAVYVV